MDTDILLFAFYMASKVSLVIAAIVFFFSGLDDVFIDAYFLVRQTYRKFFIYRKHKRLEEKELFEKEEQYIAVFIPAWHEKDVIGQMLLNTINSFVYKKYHIFVGTYPNDEDTSIEVEKVRQVYHNITKIVCPKDGPTNKADNLNWIFQGMSLFEKESGIRFQIMVIHDSEDIVHPLSLKLYNYLIPRFSMVQIPVYPLETPLFHFTSGVYVDEFSENHTKDLLVRERLDSCIPAAGVGCAFSRQAMGAMAEKNRNVLFNITSLTEDYEFGMRLRDIPGKQIFVRQALKRVVTKPNGKTKIRKEVVATREVFPSRFWASVAQKSRWTIGIAIQGWRSLGWKGNLFTKFMLYKDRRVLVTSLVYILGYLAFSYFLAEVSTRKLLGYSIFPPLVKGGTWLAYLILFDTIIMVERLAFRVIFVTRLFGPVHGIISIPRVLWGNLINFSATVRAIKESLVSLITGNPIAWAKTIHEFPSDKRLRHYRRKLGDILLERRFITVDQLTKGLEIQKETGEPIGDTLVRLGFLEEEEVMYALGKQHNTVYEDLIPYETDLDLLRTVPQSFCEKNQCYPVRSENGSMVLATSSLENVKYPEKLKSELDAGIPIRLILTSRPDIDFAIGRGYRRLSEREPFVGEYVGEKLVEANLITPRQMKTALRIQKRSNEKLGKILIKTGAIDAQDLQRFLERGK